MMYYDDILNVYAYLRSKSRRNAELSRETARQAEAARLELDSLNRQADQLLSDVDALLAQARALAGALGIGDPAAPAEVAVAEIPEPVSGEERVALPEDFDFRKDFEALRREAHAAGFTNVHPQELLTAEEMADAEAFSRELDQEFQRDTCLTGRDLLVLTLAVMVRVICTMVMRRARAAQVSAAASLELEDTALNLTDSLQSTKADISPATAEELLYQSEEYRQLLAKGQETLESGLRRISDVGALRPQERILQEYVPFDVEETELLRREDIAGFHKYLGWIVGVGNILTETVTTYRLKSYSVTRTEQLRPQVDREISTLMGVVYPLLRDAVHQKETVIAAVVQEAITLGVIHSGQAPVGQIFNRAVALEQQNQAVLERMDAGLKAIHLDWVDCVGGVAVTTLINTIVIAIHAVMYEESDGSVDTYAVRTNKILTYSGALATVINSLPAVVSQNPADLDFPGILTTCMTWFHDQRFWIEAKARFLVSAYKEKLDEEMAKLAPYFA